MWNCAPPRIHLLIFPFCVFLAIVHLPPLNPLSLSVYRTFPRNPNPPPRSSSYVLLKSRVLPRSSRLFPSLAMRGLSLWSSSLEVRKATTLWNVCQFFPLALLTGTFPPTFYQTSFSSFAPSSSGWGFQEFNPPRDPATLPDGKRGSVPRQQIHPYSDLRFPPGCRFIQQPPSRISPPTGFYWTGPLTTENSLFLSREMRFISPRVDSLSPSFNITFPLVSCLKRIYPLALPLFSAYWGSSEGSCPLTL